LSHCLGVEQASAASHVEAARSANNELELAKQRLEETRAAHRKEHEAWEEERKAVADERRRLQGEIDSAGSASKRGMEDQEHLRSELKRSKDEATSLRKTCSGLQQEVQEAQEVMGELRAASSSQLQAQEKTAEEACQELEERILRDRESHRDQIDEVRRSIGDELKQGAERLAGVEAELLTARQRCELLARNKADLLQEVAEHNSKASGVEGTIAKHRNKCETLGLDLEQVRASKESLESDLKTLREDQEHLRSELKRSKDEATSLRKTCSGLQQEVQEAQEVMGELQAASFSHLQAQEKVLEEAGQDMKTLLRENEELELQNRELVKAGERLERNLKAARKALEGATTIAADQLVGSATLSETAATTAMQAHDGMAMKENEGQSTGELIVGKSPSLDNITAQAPHRAALKEVTNRLIRPLS